MQRAEQERALWLQGALFECTLAKYFSTLAEKNLSARCVYTHMEGPYQEVAGGAEDEPRLVRSAEMSNLFMARDAINNA